MCQNEPGPTIVNISLNGSRSRRPSAEGVGTRRQRPTSGDQFYSSGESQRSRSLVRSQDLDAFDGFRRKFASTYNQRNEELLLPASRLIKVFERTCNNRRFFSTGRDHLGAGPNVVKAGDAVVVIYGCRAPIILGRTILLRIPSSANATSMAQ